jgi:hypothetical protein
MTDLQALQWIKDNLGKYIKTALELVPGTIYSEDWLAAMAYRETGILIHRYVPSGIPFRQICERMVGDYGQRPGETEKKYHGFSFWQIDIGSYPDFIDTGLWTDPVQSCKKAISVLEEKRRYLFGKNMIPTKYPLQTVHRAITAAYNCGAGSVMKALMAGKDVDRYTYNRDYSKEVWRFRDMYRIFK